MRRVFTIDPSDLYDKDIIAFGTGNVGKTNIPYLMQDTNIRLQGVTNSRIQDDNAGTFHNTGLPLRSLQKWAELYPNATILVMVFNSEYSEEIQTACNNAGFADVRFCSSYLIDQIRQSSFNHDLMQGIRIHNKDLDEIHLITNPFLQLLCLANEIRDRHKEGFSEFKACHKGKSVVVVGTGPSLDLYSQIENIPHIGVNSSILKTDLKLDYYFLGHYVPEWREALKHTDCVKFFMKPTANDFESNLYFPEDLIEETHARRFFSSRSFESIYVDIEHYPLMSFSSITFSALQFALYTLPKRILLVGCDCSTDTQTYGHFHCDHEMTPEEEEHVGSLAVPIYIKGYKKLKLFIDRYYPETEIISVNPAGLKGMFHDVYTESYLGAHPELNRNQCEVLNPADFEET